MKKLLLLCGLICATYLSQAQVTLFTQNFETSKTVIPAGWTQQKAVTSNGGWRFGNAFPGVLASYVAAHTYYAFVDDYDYNTGLVAANDSLFTSSFSCVGHDHVFITVDAMFWYYNGSETCTIAVSKDGGKTWTTAANIPQGSTNWQNGLTYDISAIAANQANVMVAFTYFNGVPNIYGAPGTGVAFDNVLVFAPLTYDLGVTSQNLQYLLQAGNSYNLSGVIHNFGGDSIVSMHLNYSVNNGPAVTTALTSLSINGNTDYSFTHPTAWTPTAGAYTVKIWADNLNGANADLNHANDTLFAKFMVIDSVQVKTVLYEEFMQASCNPCMYAAPNLNAVARTVCAAGDANFIRYHVSWPGVDYMNNETNAPFVSTRVSYYSVSGVPDAKLDGNTDSYPGSVSVSDITNAKAIGSPFKITIDSAVFNSQTLTYSAQAKIEAYGAFGAGLTAQAVITVDTIKYAADQSTEDPASSFPGTNPDSLYQYVVNFPNVAEDMMPTSAGTTLAAFTPLSTQTVTVNWKKNRPWGSSPKTDTYDSLGEHLVVFVQTKTAIAASGVPALYVFQSASVPVKHFNPLAVQEISNGVYFNMYPNPTNSNTIITYSLDKEQNTAIEVYNVLGEKVYSVDNGMTGAGQHSLTINCKGLQSGVYFVKFTTDNVTTTKRLVIQQ